MVSSRHLQRWLLLAAALGAAPAARATATVLVVQMPSAFLADNATESAVYCSIAEGYPNNFYAVKGTFSDGDLPYYGLTYVPSTTLWSSQREAWDTAQMRVQTDSNGAWKGWLYVRLEQTAPKGSIYFRCSTIPLSPVSNPGPTVSDWCECRSLIPSSAGNAGWLTGHVYTDAACTAPAQRVIVRALDAAGRVISAYLSQNSAVVDGEDHWDAGFVRLGAPRGTVFALSGRSVSGAVTPLYTRSSGPWTVYAGAATSFDALPRGDVNGDGAANLADVVSALRLCAGLEAPRPGWTARADLGADGYVSLTDAVQLARVVCGF
ncbi:MAG TPA: dockerin type I repeat-containing protein [Armatimonadota bacterium]|jgi:hypothetical protein